MDFDDELVGTIGAYDAKDDQIEVGFKAVARALRMALARQGDATELPSTKGVL